MTTQRFVLVSGVWLCRGCEAELTSAGLPSAEAVMDHAGDCPEVAKFAVADLLRGETP